MMHPCLKMLINMAWSSGRYSTVFLVQRSLEGKAAPNRTEIWSGEQWLQVGDERRYGVAAFADDCQWIEMKECGFLLACFFLRLAGKDRLIFFFIRFTDIGTYDRPMYFLFLYLCSAIRHIHVKQRLPDKVWINVHPCIRLLMIDPVLWQFSSVASGLFVSKTTEWFSQETPWCVAHSR